MGKSSVSGHGIAFHVPLLPSAPRAQGIRDISGAVGPRMQFLSVAASSLAGPPERWAGMRKPSIQSPPKIPPPVSWPLPSAPSRPSQLCPAGLLFVWGSTASATLPPS